MAKLNQIACIGEVMIELIGSDGPTAQLNVAGDTYNTAVYLAQLGQNVSYVTALGLDSFSQRALRHMRSFGLGDGFVERRADRNIGLYAIDTDDQGERSFTYWRSDSAARTLFCAPCTVKPEVLSHFDLVFLSGISLAILPPAIRADLFAALDSYRAAGGIVAYDSNHRPRLWDKVQIARDVNRQMWARTDIGLPSVDDEMQIHGDTSEDAVINRLGSYGLTRGALKRGPSGPRGLAGPTSQHFAPVTNVVDTTAAGDSFNAGYLAEIAKGGSDAEALRQGHALASKVIQHRGAIIRL